MDFSQFKAQFAPDLDPQQEAAVQTVEGPVLLLAVPGSGKTTVLVTRLGYMRLVAGIPPERILTMTYTVSAARDMRPASPPFSGRRRPKIWSFAPSTACAAGSSASMSGPTAAPPFVCWRTGAKRAP